MTAGGLVDGNAQRAQLAGQSVLLFTAWLLQSWVLVAAVGVAMGVGALWWPRGALFVRLHDRFVRPRLPAVRPADGRPPRFSAALALPTWAGPAVLVATGAETLGWAIVLAGAAAMAVEVVAGRCVTCELFVWAARRGWVRMGTPLPPGLTLFTAPRCSRCESVRAALRGLPKATWREVSVLERRDLVRALDIRSTPTLVAVDGGGRVVDVVAGEVDEERLAALADVSTADALRRP